MTLLEDIWYGNIRPVESFVDGNTEYKGLLRLVSKNRETLENELSQKQLEFFENIMLQQAKWPLYPKPQHFNMASPSAYRL